MSKTTRTLEELFRESFEDQVLNRDERSALAKILKEEPLSEREMASLRTKTFRMAEKELSDDPDTKKVFRWLKKVHAQLVPEGTPVYRHEVYFSPGETCLATILQNLKFADKSIDVCVFTINDNRISKEIMAAHDRGVKVRVISDNSMATSLGSDVVDLDKAGVPTKVDASPHHMHHKFCVFDNQIVITGSYNWTRAASISNKENIIITNDPEAVDAYRKAFNDMWKNEMIEVKKAGLTRSRGMQMDAMTAAYLGDEDPTSFLEEYMKEKEAKK